MTEAQSQLLLRCDRPSAVLPSPDYSQDRVDAIVAGFMALPIAPSGPEGSRNAWTIHLQRPTSYFVTGGENALQITVYRPGMLEPLSVPCDAARLNTSTVSHYLLELVLNVFIKEETRDALLKLGTTNMECLLPSGSGADMKGFIDQCNRDAKDLTPAGLRANTMYGWYRSKVWQEGEKPAGTIHRSLQIFVRDIAIHNILQTQVLMLKLPIQFPLHDNPESGYLARTARAAGGT